MNKDKQNKSECCEKCVYVIGGLLHGNKEVCKQMTCICHTTTEPEDHYEHHSHYHCWNQKTPACGQPLESHKQCCLCDKEYTQKKDTSWEERFDEIAPYEINGIDTTEYALKLKDFISKEIQKAQKEGYNQGLSEKIDEHWKTIANGTEMKLMQKVTRHSTILEIKEELENIPTKGYYGDIYVRKENLLKLLTEKGNK